MWHDPHDPALFPTIPHEVLEQIRPFGEEIRLEDGQQLVAEGEGASGFYVLLEGRIRITKRVGGEDRLLAIHEPGHFAGEISILSGKPTIASAHAFGPARVLKIDMATFRVLLSKCSTLADMVISAMIRRSQEVEAQMRSHEKLAALGKLSAGLAHELNNPASAARSAAGHLRHAIDLIQELAIRHDGRFSGPQRDAIIELRRALDAGRATRPALDPLTRSDREDDLAGWLEGHGIDDGWRLAPGLLDAGVTTDVLEDLARRTGGDALAGAIIWLEATSRMADLVEQVEQSTTRISDLVTAVGEYSYMDQASLQEIDLHRGLESTLKMFAFRLKGGITVERQYYPSLPRLVAHPGELNQVWTNLIDNALDAMNGEGRLTIRTAREDDGALIEIIDDGPGIPPEVLPRIFEPFFTTKGVGKGTGLGLDISYRIVTNRHHGTIRADSRPGETRVQVRLPWSPPHASR